MDACNLSQTDAIQNLKDLTDQFVRAMLETPFIEYPSGDDKIKAVGIINIPGKIGVMCLYMHAGQTFIPHRHTNREWGYIIEGELELKTNGDIQIVREGEFICYDPTQAHGGTALKDCVILFLNEDGEGYPIGQIRV